MIQGSRNFSYERRLKLLKLQSLERHTIRGDLIEVFEWVKDFNKRDVGKVLTVSSQVRTRINEFKLEKYRSRKEISKNWFTNMVVVDWNRLSQELVSAQTIEF